MLIVVAAVVSTVALLGALIVGHSSQNTIAGLPPTRADAAVLTAFPEDVEAQIKSQQMVSTGVAVLPPTSAEDNAKLLGDSLRNELDRAAGQQFEGDETINAEQALPDLHNLAAKLEDVLLKNDRGEVLDIAAVREYAVRELSTQDGTIVLPNYDVSNIDSIPGLGGELATQLSQLQENLNAQIGALPQLEGRELELQNIEMQADPRQLASAIEALSLQADLF
nr:hypothetical protein [bacterium]